MFWDSSALVPFLVREAHSVELTAVLEDDTNPTIWWATPVECVSALERRRREGALSRTHHREARQRLRQLPAMVDIVQPHSRVRDRAERLLSSHPLRAADALQLAAALVACSDTPIEETFVCLDSGLREAASQEGFMLAPSQT